MELSYPDLLDNVLVLPLDTAGIDLEAKLSPAFFADCLIIGAHDIHPGAPFRSNGGKLDRMLLCMERERDRQGAKHSTNEKSERS
jgi:hypothetical protein